MCTVRVLQSHGCMHMALAHDHKPNITNLTSIHHQAWSAKCSYIGWCSALSSTKGKERKGDDDADNEFASNTLCV